MRKLLIAVSLVLAAVLLSPLAHAQTCEPDSIPAFTCNFNCWSAVITGLKTDRPMNNCGVYHNETCSEALPLVECAPGAPQVDGCYLRYTVNRNSLCGSCGADPNEPPCGYATRAEALQCIDFYVRNGVPILRNNPRQMVDVYPYLGGYVVGPEGFPQSVTKE